MSNKYKKSVFQLIVANRVYYRGHLFIFHIFLIHFELLGEFAAKPTKRIPLWITLVLPDI